MGVAMNNHNLLSLGSYITGESGKERTSYTLGISIKWVLEMGPMCHLSQWLNDVVYTVLVSHAHAHAQTPYMKVNTTDNPYPFA